MRPSTRSPIGSIQKNHAWLPTIGQATGRCLCVRDQWEHPLKYQRSTDRAGGSWQYTKMHQNGPFKKIQNFLGSGIAPPQAPPPVRRTLSPALPLPLTLTLTLTLALPAFPSAPSAPRFSRHRRSTPRSTPLFFDKSNAATQHCMPFTQSLVHASTR